MINKLTIIFAAGLISFAANATQPHQAIIDLAYSEEDESELNGETFRIQLPIKQGVFLSGSKTEMDQDVETTSLFDGSYSKRELGGGFYWQTSPDASMYLAYHKVDFEPAAGESENLTKYSLGWRGRLSQRFELTLEYNQTDFTDSNIDKGGYTAGVHFYATPTFAITLDTERWFEQDRLLLGVRFTSGR